MDGHPGSPRLDSSRALEFVTSVLRPGEELLALGEAEGETYFFAFDAPLVHGGWSWLALTQSRIMNVTPEGISSRLWREIKAFYPCPGVLSRSSLILETPGFPDRHRGGWPSKFFVQRRFAKAARRVRLMPKMDTEQESTFIEYRAADSTFSCGYCGAPTYGSRRVELDRCNSCQRLQRDIRYADAE